MTSRELTALGRRYMRLLALQEWIPNTYFMFAYRQPVRKQIGADAVGQTTWSAERKSAIIILADPKTLADDEPHRPIGQIIGETLIHELLHIRMEGHKEHDGIYDEGYECGLNKTAEAIWKAWS